MLDSTTFWLAIGGIAAGIAGGWILARFARGLGRRSGQAAAQLGAETVLELIAQLKESLDQPMDADQIAQAMRHVVDQALAAERLELWRWDALERRLVAHGLSPEAKTPLSRASPDGPRIADQRLASWLNGQARPLLLPDHYPSKPSENPAGLSLDSLGSYIVVPVQFGDTFLGALEIGDRRVKAYGPDHVRLVELTASLIGRRLNAAYKLHQSSDPYPDARGHIRKQAAELSRKHAMADALMRVTSALASSVDLDRSFSQALSLVGEMIEADAGIVVLLEPYRSDLTSRATMGIDQFASDPGSFHEFLELLGPLAKQIVHEAEPRLIPNLAAHPWWPPSDGAHAKLHSAIAAPLALDQGALGAVIFLRRQPDGFRREQLRLVSAASHQLAAGIYYSELYRLIRDQAENLGSLLRDKQVEASKTRAILESIADGVIVTDSEDQVVLFNASAERILGLQREHVLGESLFEFIGVYGPATQRWMQATQSWRSPDREQARPAMHLEEQLTLEDSRVVSVHLAPVVFAEEFLGTVSIFRDITREVEVDRLKSEFVATVSHELRTPLTSIKGYVEMLSKEAVGPTTEHQSRFLNIILANIDRLSNLVDDLLDISRIESGGVRLELQAVDIGEVMAEIQAAVARRSELEDKSIRIQVELPPDLPPVQADRKRLRQILTNLVANSFNYSPPGGSIRLTARHTSGEIEIEVGDNGIGIPIDEQHRVFERFYRGEGALNMSVAGSGLGLPIVRQLVEMHQGQIWLASDGIPGGGTRFTFTLPAVAVARQASEGQG